MVQTCDQNNKGWSKKYTHTHVRRSASAQQQLRRTTTTQDTTTALILHARPIVVNLDQFEKLKER